jgi:hypothetical protein
MNNIVSMHKIISISVNKKKIVLVHQYNYDILHIQFVAFFLCFLRFRPKHRGLAVLFSSLLCLDTSNQINKYLQFKKNKIICFITFIFVNNILFLNIARRMVSIYWFSCNCVQNSFFFFYITFAPKTVLYISF